MVPRRRNWHRLSPRTEPLFRHSRRLPALDRSIIGRCSLQEQQRRRSPFPTRTATSSASTTFADTGCCCGGTRRPRHPVEQFRDRRCVTAPTNSQRQTASCSAHRSIRRTRTSHSPLLSDVDRAVGTAYGVVRPSGHQYSDYPERASFLIDPDGIVRRVYEVTDVAHHAADVLADLAVLQA